MRWLCDSRCCYRYQTRWQDSNIVSDDQGDLLSEEPFDQSILAFVVFFIFLDDTSVPVYSIQPTPFNARAARSLSRNLFFSLFFSSPPFCAIIVSLYLIFREQKNHQDTAQKKRKRKKAPCARARHHDHHHHLRNPPAGFDQSHRSPDQFTHPVLCPPPTRVSSADMGFSTFSLFLA